MSPNQANSNNGHNSSVNADSPQPTGHVLNIQRFSIHDGPGLRTTVFLKGCPLSCAWCQNPESISTADQMMYSQPRCINCGLCVEACPAAAHQLDGGEHVFIREKCTLCGKCVDICPSGALEIAGKLMSVAEVFEQVLRDEPYYSESGGGVTISGGEALLQAEFSFELLKLCREKDIHTCFDTTGFGAWQKLEKLTSVTSLFLYDIKLTDDKLHRQLTGQGTQLIHQNLRALDCAGAAIELRCPVIPTINDNSQHFEAVAALSKSLKTRPLCRILPYHSMAKSKYSRLGIEAPLSNITTMPDGSAAQWVKFLQDRGVSASL